LRDPETGRRVTRPRGKEEWLRKEVPELRIVSEELWQRVKARQANSANRRLRGQRGGATRHAYLFSGLLRCAECGSHYTARGGGRYVCSFHKNRGPTVCSNARVARRDALEQRLLQVIEQDILSPEAIAYLADRVNAALRQAHGRRVSARQATEAELRQADQEAENIKQAVRHGKATETLLEMLEEVETKIRRLRAESQVQPHAEETVVRVPPESIERHIRDLRGVLGRDTERARYLLSRLLGEVILRPDKHGLVAEVRGNLGVLLEDVPSIGAGRGI
jgi:site-specific DNA recombinase